MVFCKITHHKLLYSHFILLNSSFTHLERLGNSFVSQKSIEKSTFQLILGKIFQIVLLYVSINELKKSSIGFDALFNHFQINGQIFQIATQINSFKLSNIFHAPQTNH
jgi:hypothetical protein